MGDFRKCVECKKTKHFSEFSKVGIGTRLTTACKECGRNWSGCHAIDLEFTPIWKK